MIETPIYFRTYIKLILLKVVIQCVIKPKIYLKFVPFHNNVHKKTHMYLYILIELYAE